MSTQIIKDEKTGKYALFSSITDTFLLRNATTLDLFNHYMEIHAEQTLKNIQNIIQKLEKDEAPYYNFTLTLQEAIEISKRRSNNG